MRIMGMTRKQDTSQLNALVIRSFAKVVQHVHPVVSSGQFARLLPVVLFPSLLRLRLWLLNRRRPCHGSGLLLHLDWLALQVHHENRLYGDRVLDLRELVFMNRAE